MPRRQSRQVWRRLGEETGGAMAPPVEEPFVADEMLVVGAEIVVPVSMPVVVVASAFEPEVLIQTETINLTEGQEQLIRENEQRVLNEKFKTQAGDLLKEQCDLNDVRDQHVKRCATYNDGVMTTLCLQMAGADPDDLPYVSIQIDRDRIPSKISKLPWHVRSIGEKRMSVAVSKDRHSMESREQGGVNGYQMNIPIMDFLKLQHEHKQRLYDPIMWQWVYLVADEIMDEYFCHPFNLQDVSAHIIRVTEEYDGRNDEELATEDDNAMRKIAEKIGRFAFRRREFVADNRWETAKNYLFKDLGIKKDPDDLDRLWRQNNKTVLGAYCESSPFDLDMGYS